MTEKTKSLLTPFRVRLQDKKKAIHYYGKIALSYETHVNNGFLKVFRNSERNAILGFLDLDHPDLSFVDIGCGGGFYSREAKRKHCYVMSLDINPAMLESLKTVVDATDTCDIEHMNLGREFDRVLCTGVLDFVTNPEAAFRNLCKLVAPRGHLIVLAPRQGLGGFYYRIEKWLAGFRINLYRRQWFAAIAAEYGLHLKSFRHPLPTNMALRFEREAVV